MDNNYILATVFASNENGTYSIPYRPEDVFQALKAVVPQIHRYKVKNITDFGLSMDVSVGLS